MGGLATPWWLPVSGPQRGARSTLLRAEVYGTEPRRRPGRTALDELRLTAVAAQRHSRVRRHAPRRRTRPFRCRTGVEPQPGRFSRRDVRVHTSVRAPTAHVALTRLAAHVQTPAFARGRRTHVRRTRAGGVDPHPGDRARGREVRDSGVRQRWLSPPAFWALPRLRHLRLLQRHRGQRTQSFPLAREGRSRDQPGPLRLDRHERLGALLPLHPLLRRALGLGGAPLRLTGKPQDRIVRTGARALRQRDADWIAVPLYGQRGKESIGSPRPRRDPLSLRRGRVLFGRAVRRSLDGSGSAEPVGGLADRARLGPRRGVPGAR